jgi:hypothetical protein
MRTQKRSQREASCQCLYSHLLQGPECLSLTVKVLGCTFEGSNQEGVASDNQDGKRLLALRLNGRVVARQVMLRRHPQLSFYAV